MAGARCDSGAPSVLASICSFSPVATSCCSSSPGAVPSDAAAPGVLSSAGTDHRCSRSLAYGHLFDESSQTTLPSSWHTPLRSLRGLLLKRTSIRPSVAISPVPRKPSSSPSLIATISLTCAHWSFPCLYQPGRGRRGGELGRGTSGGALDGQTAPMASSYVCRHAGQPNGSLSQNGYGLMLMLMLMLMMMLKPKRVATLKPKLIGRLRPKRVGRPRPEDVGRLRPKQGIRQ